MPEKTTTSPQTNPPVKPINSGPAPKKYKKKQACIKKVGPGAYAVDIPNGARRLWLGSYKSEDEAIRARDSGMETLGGGEKKDWPAEKFANFTSYVIDRAQRAATEEGPSKVHEKATPLPVQEQLDDRNSPSVDVWDDLTDIWDSLSGKSAQNSPGPSYGSLEHDVASWLKDDE